MNKKAVLISLAFAVAALAIAAGVSLYQDRGTPPDTGNGGATNAPSEAEILQDLAAEWPEIEQGPLRHEAESGRWFLTQVQFIGPATLMVWYEDGLNDEFSILEHDDGQFRVAARFADRAELANMRTTHGEEGASLNIYLYDNDSGIFSPAPAGTVFGGGNAVPPQDGGTTSVSIALLNPDGTLPNEVKPGDVSGCDHVVLRQRSIPTTRAPLTAALNELLAAPGGWSEGNKVYNYAGQGGLSLASVSVIDGTARVHLTGSRPPIAGVCDEPRLFVQVAQTARQFPTVEEVELFVNGERVTASGQGQ